MLPEISFLSLVLSFSSTMALWLASFSKIKSLSVPDPQSEL